MRNIFWASCCLKRKRKRKRKRKESKKQNIECDGCFVDLRPYVSVSCCSVFRAWQNRCCYSSSFHSWLQNLEDSLCLKFFFVWLLFQKLRSLLLLLCNETANIIQDLLCQVIARKIIFDSQVKIKLRIEMQTCEKWIFFPKTKNSQFKTRRKIVVCEKEFEELFCRYLNWILLLRGMFKLIGKKRQEILNIHDNPVQKMP